MLERIEQLRQESQSDLTGVRDLAGLEQYRLKYLAGSGVVKKLMAMLKDVPSDQKPRLGQLANELKNQIQAGYESRKNDLSPSPAPVPGIVSGDDQSGVSGLAGAAAGVTAAALSSTGPQVDMSLPGVTPVPGGLGRTHVITRTIEELIEVFGRMGFDVATGPEVEDEWHNFVALNIPPEHPARDPLDNFYIDLPQLGDSATVAGAPKAVSKSGGGGAMLRSQTSTIQIRVMEKTQPPVRVVAVGRVYRPDEHDATHYSMFHQIEGLYVDRRVSMVDLKTTLLQFAHLFFGPEAEVRLRPSFFPFTEPSAEMDVKMNIGGQWVWKELGGCGMVDPNVFEAVGYDPEKWTGFAFGLGIERVAMRKYNIPDLRWMFDNDVRFLKQF